jgi:anti-sigma B factor antagonist
MTVPTFEARPVVVHNASGVAVSGEVDLATAPALAERLEESIRESREAFVIDLSETTFVDSSGLHCLLRARGLLGRNDRLLVLVCPPGNVRRALRITGVDDLFAICDTAEQAAQMLRPQPAS